MEAIFESFLPQNKPAVQYLIIKVHDVNVAESVRNLLNNVYTANDMYVKGLQTRQ